MIYQDKHLYYLRKPAGVASTWGKEKCFLDMLESHEYEHRLAHHQGDHYHDDMALHLEKQLAELGVEKVTHVHAVVNSILHTFSHAQEYGLLNRLDTPTAGFLYFAKDTASYAHYKQAHKDKAILKHYLARVDGHVEYLLDNDHPHDEVAIHEGRLHIYYPLMHHKHADDRMIVITDQAHIKKGRGKLLEQHTICKALEYDIETNHTLLHITIASGARHQIRAHLAALGYPILGEELYTKKQDHQHMSLHLWSVGCEIVE